MKQEYFLKQKVIGKKKLKRKSGDVEKKIWTDNKIVSIPVSVLY